MPSSRSCFRRGAKSSQFIAEKKENATSHHFLPLQSIYNGSLILEEVDGARLDGLAEEDCQQLCCKSLYDRGLAQVFEPSRGIAVGDGHQLLVQHDELFHVVPELVVLAARHFWEQAGCCLIRLNDNMPARSAVI